MSDEAQLFVQKLPDESKEHSDKCVFIFCDLLMKKKKP